MEFTCWFYDSPVGRFTIVDAYDDRLGPLLELRLDGIPCNASIQTPEAAADAVCNFATGLFEWDELEGEVSPPTELSSWTLSEDASMWAPHTL